MTDIAATRLAGPRRIDVTSPEANARVRARYRREARFRTYGVVALGITAVFVALVLFSIFLRGVGAFWQHSLVLDVSVPAEEVSTNGKPDPDKIRTADYFGFARAALEKALPGVESRHRRKHLASLLSSGAGDPIREVVADDPSSIGRAIRSRIRLSANADLYLKKPSTLIERRAGPGTAVVTLDGSDATIVLPEKALAVEVAAIKDRLRTRSAALSGEADRLARLDQTGQADRIKQLREEAAALSARASNSSAEEELDDKVPSLLLAVNGGLIKVATLTESKVIGRVILALAENDVAKPGTWQLVRYATPESDRRASDAEVAFLERLKEAGAIERHFNWLFFRAGDSREPELAGIRGAIVGSALTLLVTLALCLPIGVLAAIYLEEFAPKNRLTYLIEVNINNLAAVPSIVFGLLGLAVFLNFFGLPRSAPLVGGLVLALLVLPTIIIAARAALKAVPPSIKEAALGVGASHQQAVFHHVLPLAMPGIMTGTIIGMAHALGETAPLLMIGMVAFIVDVPGSFTDAATVLPVQIYLWSDLPEPAFEQKTAAAIIVLLGFLFLMNGAAIWLRRKFERRW